MGKGYFQRLGESISEKPFIFVILLLFTILTFLPLGIILWPFYILFWYLFARRPEGERASITESPGQGPVTLGPYYEPPQRVAANDAAKVNYGTGTWIFMGSAGGLALAAPAVVLAIVIIIYGTKN